MHSPNSRLVIDEKLHLNDWQQQSTHFSLFVGSSSSGSSGSFNAAMYMISIMRRRNTRSVCTYRTNVILPFSVISAPSRTNCRSSSTVASTLSPSTATSPAVTVNVFHAHISGLCRCDLSARALIALQLLMQTLCVTTSSFIRPSFSNGKCKQADVFIGSQGVVHNVTTKECTGEGREPLSACACMLAMHDA